MRWSTSSVPASTPSTRPDAGQRRGWSQTDESGGEAPPIGRLTRDAKKEKQGHGTRTAQEPHAARVSTFSGVVDRREALAVPLVHVGARVDQRLEARGVGPGTPVLGSRLLRARYKFEVALVIILTVLDALAQLHLPLDHAHLDAGHDEGLALVRRRPNLAQFFREPASGVASMASRW